MKESKLQSIMVIDFSQQRPNEKGLLWSTSNRTLSMKDGQKQKAMGLIAGVADLIYFKDGVLNGIEVKVAGKEHQRSHIQSQYYWGLKVIQEGGTYHIVTSLEDFWSVINGKINDSVYHIGKIKHLLDFSKSKIIF